MTVEALIFDFDGTLVDTEVPDWETWCAVYREHGVELDLARWQIGIGTHGGFDPCAHLEELLGAAINRQAIEERRWVSHVALCEQQPIQPGALQLLDAADAAGLRIGLASSSSWRWVGRWFHHYDLAHRFACIRTCDGDLRPKPAPDLYLSAAAGLGVAPERCLAFEDSPNGMRAALAAGMRCVVVPTPVTAALDFTGAALRLASLAEVSLPELLDQIGLPVAS